MAEDATNNNNTPAAADPSPAPAAAPAPAPAPIAAAPSPAPAAVAAPSPAPAAPTNVGNAPTIETTWRDTIADKKLREYADRYTSPTDLVAAALKLRDDVSSRIKIPDADAAPEEVAKYRKALGIPDDPKGYEVKVPEGLDLNDIDKAMLDAIRPVAHEAGVSAKAFERLATGWLQMAREVGNQLQAQSVEVAKQNEAQLRQEWGPEFDVNLNVARRVAGALGPDFQKFLNETQLSNGGMLGDHPAMAKILSTFGRRMGEGDLHIGSTPQEKNSAMDEINKLNAAVPVGSREYTTAAHQAKLQALYEKLHGSNPLIGNAQRVA